VVLGIAAGSIARAIATRDSAPPLPAAAPAREDVAAGSGAPRETKPTTPATRPTLTVVTEPPGAAIRVDGAPRGQAPITIPVELGRRVLIEAEHDGFESAKQTLAAEREAQTVTLSLTARPTTKPADVQPDARPTVRPVRDIKPSKPTEAPPRPFNERDVGGD
jgi:hypothetical protein